MVNRHDILVLGPLHVINCQQLRDLPGIFFTQLLVHVVFFYLTGFVLNSASKVVAYFNGLGLCSSSEPLNIMTKLVILNAARYDRMLWYVHATICQSHVSVCTPTCRCQVQRKIHRIHTG